MNLSGVFEVGGKATINGTLKAETVEIGGSLRAQKATVESRVTVGGSIETEDGVHASYVEVGRRGKVKGSLNAEEVFIGKGAHIEDVYAKRITLKRGAKARNLHGDSIRLDTGCHISGEVRYTSTLEADRDVKFDREPRKEN
jgi:cytoskeletal protein CcmA (bactofilin family)